MSDRGCRDEPPIEEIVVVFEEDALAAVAPLGDVMRDTGNHDPRQPRHILALRLAGLAIAVAIQGWSAVCHRNRY